jgi:protein-L-isoaspartate O-methyltransferase
LVNGVRFDEATRGDGRDVPTSRAPERTPVRVPTRVEFALDVLDLAPHHRVLEFGCGGGVAAACVAARLTTGRVTAIDRSPRAIARAIDVAPDVRFRHVELADFETDQPFDRALGINVNLFWTGRAEVEAEVLRRSITPRGMVVLVYETPGDVRAEIVEKSAASLDHAGFTCETICGPDASLVAIRARTQAGATANDAVAPAEAIADGLRS